MNVHPIGVPPSFLNVFHPLWQAAMLRRYLLYTRTCQPRKSTCDHVQPPLGRRSPLLVQNTMALRSLKGARQCNLAYAVYFPPADVPVLDIEWPGETPPADPQIITVDRPVPVDVWLTGTVLDVLY